MANRGLMTGLPIWVRVPAVIAAVLAGVFASAVLVGAAGVGGSHEPSGDTPDQEQQQEQVDPDDGGGHDPSEGSH